MGHLWLLMIIAYISQVNGASKPNIIFILADDLGWDDVSFHGSTQIPTPNLDSLAYDGVLLSNYYVQPICTPTRCALMTGRHPIHTGLQHSVILGSQPYGLGLNETILPQYLQQLGYTSHIVGKWHLGFFAKEYTPLYRGFSSHFGYYLGHGDYYDHTHATHSDLDETWQGSTLDGALPTSFFDHAAVNDKFVADIPQPNGWGFDLRKNMDLVYNKYGLYSTDLFASEAVNIVNNHNASQPLFLYLPFQAVHSGNPIFPLEAPAKYVSRFPHIATTTRKTFAGMVSALDDAVGTVFNALHAKGMLDNSIIIFSTDNGGPASGFDMNDASNWPLRGVKATLWEGGVRGTGFIWSPLLKKSGRTSDAMMQVIDWLPTVLHAAGFDMSKLPTNIDGLDMWDVLSENEPSPRQEILHNIDPKQKTFALRSGDYKIISGLAYQGKWSGWYPPHQTNHKSVTFSNDLHNLDMKVMDQSGFRYTFPSKVEPLLRRLGRTSRGKPVVVQCGPKPTNASTNCQPTKAPCVYNIALDPCEYNNLAPDHPDLVSALMSRIRAHNATAVPPRNKPADPAGLPMYNNGGWVPWVKLDQKSVHLRG